MPRAGFSTNWAFQRRCLRGQDRVPRPFRSFVRPPACGVRSSAISGWETSRNHSRVQYLRARQFRIDPGRRAAGEPGIVFRILGTDQMTFPVFRSSAMMASVVLRRGQDYRTLRFRCRWHDSSRRWWANSTRRRRSGHTAARHWRVFPIGVCFELQDRVGFPDACPVFASSTTTLPRNVQQDTPCSRRGALFARGDRDIQAAFVQVGRARNLVIPDGLPLSLSRFACPWKRRACRRRAHISEDTRQISWSLDPSPARC